MFTHLDPTGDLPDPFIEVITILVILISVDQLIPLFLYKSVLDWMLITQTNL